MVASRISVLILSLKDGFPNRSVFVKLGKLNLHIWESIFLRLLMSVHLSLRKKRQWRRVNAGLDVRVTITGRVERILKTVLKFIFLQMTQT